MDNKPRRHGSSNDDKASNRINEEIRVPRVRLVGDNVEQGIYDTREALRIAEEQEMDLVEISPNADPPVCKVIEYSKFLYALKKKAKEMKANASKVVIKVIRFGPQTDEHDFNFKKNHAIKFLEEGAKVKVYVFFKGRSILFQDQGKLVLLRLADELADYGKVEQLPTLEGKRMIMTIVPKKKK